MMTAEDWVTSVTGAPISGAPELVQELWSGYGRIERWHIGPDAAAATDAAAPARSVILKAVAPPAPGGDHPRGWSTDRSHGRKLRSYDVERSFYAKFSAQLPNAARVPRYLGGAETATGSLMLLEDLDAAGYGERRSAVSEADVQACLSWLAAFHATFLGAAPTDLWERGTYWHLATRPDELAATRDAALVAAAPRIDAKLSDAQFKTLVHGDAKLANFCFGGAPGGGPQVAAVDFQYIGGGAGVQDVAYFLGSCFDDTDLHTHAERYLDTYFTALREALSRALEKHPNAPDTEALEEEWRTLWPYAWADFHRFLAGWSPDHWKLSTYSKARLRECLRSLA